MSNDAVQLKKRINSHSRGRDIVKTLEGCNNLAWGVNPRSGITQQLSPGRATQDSVDNIFIFLYHPSRVSSVTSRLPWGSHPRLSYYTLLGFSYNFGANLRIVNLANGYLFRGFYANEYPCSFVLSVQSV